MSVIFKYNIAVMVKESITDWGFLKSKEKEQKPVSKKRKKVSNPEAEEDRQLDETITKGGIFVRNKRQAEKLKEFEESE